MGSEFYDWATDDVITAARLNQPWTATGQIDASEVKGVELDDNQANCFEFIEGSNSYMKFVTTNSGEKIVIGKTLDIDAASVDVATQATSISIIDNNAAALDIKEGSNSYLKFVTTNGSEGIAMGKGLTMGAGANIAMSSTSFIVLARTDTDGTSEASLWYDASENKLKFKTAAGVETITSA